MRTGDPSPNAAHPPVVALRGIGRTFAGPPEVEVLKDIDLTVAAGDYLSIIGPSGSGKSTLLHLLGLLDRPSVGSYHLNDIDTGELDERDRAALRGSQFGFVFQAFHLLPTRTAHENVMLADLYRGTNRLERAERAATALHRVGLAHRMNAFPDTLSGGERQRVAIARAVVGQPSLLFADEPTGNLDTETSDSILDLFADLYDAGLTVVVITHNKSVSDRADRVVRIVDGRIAGDS